MKKTQARNAVEKEEQGEKQKQRMNTRKKDEGKTKGMRREVYSRGWESNLGEEIEDEETYYYEEEDEED